MTTIYRLYKKLLFPLAFTSLLCLNAPIFSQTEASRISELIELSKKNSRFGDSLAVYGKELITFKDSLAKIEGHFALGYSFYQYGNLVPAKLHYDTALNFTNPKSQYPIFSRIKRNKAIVLQRMGDIDSALETYQELMAMAINLDDLPGQALMHNQIGILLQRSSNYSEAAESFNKAIDIYLKTTPESEAVTNAMLNLGTLYGRMELLDESNKRLIIAANNAKKYNQENMLARCYNNIAVNYRRLSKSDSSNYYLSASEKIYASLNLQRDLIGIYQNKVSNYILLENKDSSYHYLRLAREMNSTRNDQFRGKQLDFIEAQVELNFGSAEKAIQLVNVAISKSIAQNQVDDLTDHYTLLSEAYEKSGNTQAALNVMRKWKNLSDSLEIYRNIKTIQEITLAYDFARTEELMMESQAEKRFFQRLSNQLAVGAVVLAVICLWFYINYKKKSSEASLKEGELEDLKLKLEQLQVDAKKSDPKFITLKSKAVIPLERLMLIQSDGHYLEFFLQNKDKPEIDRGSLKDLKEELPAKSFIQVHRSYIININFIREVYSNKVVLQNDRELNISRTFKTNIDEVFLNKPT